MKQKNVFFITLGVIVVIAACILLFSLVQQDDHGHSEGHEQQEHKSFSQQAGSEE